MNYFHKFVNANRKDERNAPSNITEEDLVYFESLLSIFVPSMVFKSFYSLSVMISDSFIIISRHLAGFFSSLEHLFLVQDKSIPF